MLHNQRVGAEGKSLIPTLVVLAVAMGLLAALPGCSSDRGQGLPSKETLAEAEKDDAAAEQWLAEAEELVDKGQYEKALQMFESGLARQPKSGQAWYSKGCLLAEMDRHPEAVAAFETASKLGTAEQASLAFYNKGVSHQELGNAKEAEVAYRKSVELDPANADGWNNLGIMLDEFGKRQQAIDCFDKSLALSPQDPVTLTNRSNSLAGMGRYDEAITGYEKALSLDPTDKTARAALKQCVADKKKAGR
jgi:tetratricopeptide (TPR) repeat protein